MTRRRWAGWAVLTSEDELHRISMVDPAELPTMVNARSDLGWRWIPVEIIEAVKA